jgi:hypothetical protein
MENTKIKSEKVNLAFFFGVNIRNEFWDTPIPPTTESSLQSTNGLSV